MSNNSVGSTSSSNSTTSLLSKLQNLIQAAKTKLTNGNNSTSQNADFWGQLIFELQSDLTKQEAIIANLHHQISTDTVSMQNVQSENLNFQQQLQNLQQRLATSQSEQEVMKNDLSACSINLSSLLNKNKSTLVTLLVKIGQDYNVESFKSLNIFSLDMQLDQVAFRQKLLQDIKRLFLRQAFDLDLAVVGFDFDMEQYLLDANSFSTEGFLQFLYAIIFELKKKKILN